MLITSHYPASNVPNGTQIVPEHVTQTKLQMNENYYYCRHHVDDQQYYRGTDNRMVMLPLPRIFRMAYVGTSKIPVKYSSYETHSNNKKLIFKKNKYSK